MQYSNHNISLLSEDSLKPYHPHSLCFYLSGPVLHVGDKQIGQSKAIERYIAKLTNMMGTNDIEAAQIDCVTEHIRDIKGTWLDCNIVVI